MPDVTRRSVLEAGAAASAAAAATTSAGAAPRAWDVAVVGAGVFGAWTAWNLQRAGKRVLLIDAWAPAHARASSGGESRLTRTAYGGDEVYTRWAWDSLKEWRWLSAQSGLPIFHEAGVLFFFGREEPYLSQTMEVHRRLKLPTTLLRGPEMARKFPQMSWEGVDYGLYEPKLGALMARRSVQTLVQLFVREGGEYLQAAIRPPAPGKALAGLTTAAGDAISAGQYCFACGPWLSKIFPDLLGDRLFVTRQEVFFFAPEPGDRRFGVGGIPGWADFNGGDIWYGFPDLEGRGFKIANDVHGPPMDPDAGDRTPTPASLQAARDYMARRFPGLAGRPLSEARVCQYENSSSGDFLIDRHPDWPNVLLLGAGSGHGFKHGPAVGQAAAAMLLEPGRRPEARFSLAAKDKVQNRAVH
jgi:glycine/D-amino acid oxidase-like deaminating enzyme